MRFKITLPPKRSRRRSEVGGWVRGAGAGVRPWVYWALSGGDGGGGGGGRGPRPAPRANPDSNGSNGGAGALDAAAAGSRRTVRIPRPVPRPQCPRPSVRSSARSPARPPSARPSRPAAKHSKGPFRRCVGRPWVPQQRDHAAQSASPLRAATAVHPSVRQLVRPSARPPARPLVRRPPVASIPRQKFAWCLTAARGIFLWISGKENFWIR